MWFNTINWVLVVLIIIASELLFAINKIKFHFDSLKVDKIEVKERIEVRDIKHK